MAVGNWTDQRATYFFQKQALSADQDVGAENVYKLLLQSGHIFSDWLNENIDTQVVADYVNLPSSGSGIGQTLRQIEFSATIHDGCPWDRIRLDIYIFSSNDADFTNNIRLRRYDNSGTVTMIDIAVTTGGDFRINASADITGLTPQVYNFQLEYAVTNDVGGTLITGPASVSFMSTVTGLVS